MIKKFSIALLLFIILNLSSVLTINAKTYRIGCLEDYYPYSSIDEEGEFEGIIIDWWKLWSTKTNIDIELIPVTILGAQQALMNNEIDIIFSVYYTNQRSEKLDFADPIMRMKTVLFIKEELDNLEQIEGYISVINGSITSNFLTKNYPFLQQNKLISVTEMHETVKEVIADGFVYDLPDPVGNYKEIDAPTGYREFTTLFSNQLKPAIIKGNTNLLNDIITGSNLITSEELLDLTKNYKFFTKKKTTLYVIAAITILLLLVIIFLLLNIQKRKKKAKYLAGMGPNTDWQVILDKGENDHIEFKSSLRWDYRQEKPNKALEMVIIKTISAFLNTEGGMLFIGVDDEGKSLGLQPDYNSFSKKSRDGFLLALTNLINQHLGKRIHQFLTFNIISINEKDVCIVNIEKSDKPVFFGKGDNEEFYIRTSASSQPLGIRESHEYISSNWNKKA